jgi:hypothetical protein
MIKKICKTCNTEKTLDLFPIGKNYKYGVIPNCKHHYTNLQPLCSKVNRDIKRNNITY